MTDIFRISSVLCQISWGPYSKLHVLIYNYKVRIFTKFKIDYFALIATAILCTCFL